MSPQDKLILDKINQEKAQIWREFDDQISQLTEAKLKALAALYGRYYRQYPHLRGQVAPEVPQETPIEAVTG